MKAAIRTSKTVLQKIWEKEHTPMILALAIVALTYLVITSKLIEYIVAGV